jgi:hypothetical protein
VVRNDLFEKVTYGARAFQKGGIAFVEALRQERAGRGTIHIEKVKGCQGAS